MITLDGVEYTVKTAAENTQDMLNTINDYCSTHNILNSKNELVQLEAKMSSPIYCVLWGLGYLITITQNLIYGLGKLHSIQSAPDNAVLNLADMAAIKRGRASVTTFTAYVRAMTADDDNFDADTQTCTITSEDVITYQGITYKPALHPSLVLQPGEAGYLTFVAQSEGSYEIAEEAISGFDTTITNLGAFKQNLAIPGQSEESISDLRVRLQRRQLSGTSIDTAMDAIRALPGVTLCNIVYNTKLTSSMQLGTDGIIIPPRHAACLVQGYNTQIAQTYFSYITAPSIEASNVGTALNRIVDTQEYVSHANQRIPLLIIAPALKALYVTVYIGMSVSSNIEMAMKDAVCTIADGLTAGEYVTTAMILDTLKSFAGYSILGATVSDGISVNSSYSTRNLSSQAEDVLWTFNVNNISINMPEVES